MVRITNYEDKYYDSLLQFSKRVWPKKSEAYLRYRLYEILNGERRDTNVLLMDDDKVVGCNLIFPAKAMINGIEENVSWSHDTFIDEAYRGDWGMEMFLTIKTLKNCWGLGLSNTSKKMFKKQRYVFLSPLKSYIGCNIWSIKYLLQKAGVKNKEIKKTAPSQIKVGKNLFSLTGNADYVRVPNDGYWNKGQTAVDFIRDKEFLDTRFFNNFNKYYFYRLENESEYDKCYFVIRFIKYKNADFISLVDYRYDLTQPEQFETIIKAVKRIAMANKAPFYRFSTTVERKPKDLRSMIFQMNGYSDLITNNKNVSPDANVIITVADSDKDFCII